MSPDITGLAFVPMTPLLFRHLSGLADPVADLREAAVEAVRETCADAGQVLVLCPVGGREAPGDWHDPARSGPAHGGPRSLAEQVGEHLLALAGVTAPATFLECTDGMAGSDPLAGTSSGLQHAGGDRNLAVVVLGDGAAARSQGAPGHIDDRSFGFDDEIAVALAAGDAASLERLARSPEATGLMVTGRHTWPLAVRLAGAVDGGLLTHRSDPFGLTYLVARW